MSKTIVARLLNWGDCQRGRSGGVMTARETRRASPYGGQGYQCMTNVVCNMMKMAAEGAKGGSRLQARLDFIDAAKVQRAYQKMTVRHQLLLKDLYVLGKSPNTICRLLSIKHTPGYHWNSELKAALDAMEKVIDPWAERKKD